jgi:hypothetical protein
MKRSLLVLAFASLIAVFVADAVTPTPRPTVAKSPPSRSPAPPASDTDKSPAPRPTPEDLASPTEPPPSAPAAAQPTVLANQAPPKPVLYLIGTESYTAGGKNWIRHRYDVFNKADYPADMFAAAPSLPPCGSNTNASRTWVDFFDSTGKRLYGFCALSKPEDLGKIWVAFEDGVVPPSYVYIELNDRQTNTKLKSNLADTTL